MPAECAEPGEERGLAAEGAELADGLADRRLRDVAGRVPIEADPHERESVQDRIGGIEELLKRRLVAAQHTSDELEVGFDGSQNATRMPNVAMRSNLA